MKKIAMLIALTSCMAAAHAAGDIGQGKALVDKYACAKCHGADFNSPTEPAYPRLAGQHEDYLRHALIAYKRGNAGMNGRTNAIMADQAKPLSHKDIDDIAAYLHSLPGALVLRK